MMTNHTSGPRVLVVDDDAATREVLRFLLEERGYSVLEATDGLAALAILHSLPYGVVVLCNHNMPRLDGPGFFSRVLSDSALASHNVFIYMSAGSRVIPPSLQHQLAELRARRLRKPFTVDAVLEVVGQAARQLASSRHRHAADEQGNGDRAPTGPSGAS